MTSTKRQTRIGETRGAPRVWIEGQWVAEAGFNVGDRYDIIDAEGAGFVLKITLGGKYKVSKKTKAGRLLPVIDLRRPDETVGSMLTIISLGYGVLGFGRN